MTLSMSALVEKLRIVGSIVADRARRGRFVALAAAGTLLQIGGTALAASTTPDLLYFSTVGSTTVPGVTSPYDDADIYRYDRATGKFDRAFDASKAGLPSNADIDALYVVDPVTFYMSFRADAGTAVPGLGTVQDEDIVRYHAGKFSWFMRGADVGLGDNGTAEDVNGLHLRSDGSVLLTTAGTAYVPGISRAKRTDVMRCVGSFGDASSCTWSLYLVGGQVGLTESSENIDGLFELDGDVYFSTTGNFSVTGLSGGNDDVSRCDNTHSGPPLNCAAFDNFFDGRLAGLTDDVDAVHFAPDALADSDPDVFRVVVLGSSTAQGTGASEPAKSWVGLLDVWLSNVTARHEVINLAKGGLTTYDYRPDGVSPLPDANRNITRALELNPDLVIMNLPSNNAAAGISVSKTIAHYQLIKGRADAKGVPFLLTTTQPRNFTDLSLRVRLQDETIAIRSEFGAAVIDVYDELTDFNNSLGLKAIYDSGDGVHLNDAGHGYVFETARGVSSEYLPP